MKKTEFKALMKEADKLYNEGNYSSAIDKADSAIKAAESEEEMVRALERYAWACQKVGYKTNDDALRAKMYDLASSDWGKLILLTSDLKKRLSYMKGIMLVTSNLDNIKETYNDGCVMIKEKVLDYQEGANLMADLGNSWGIQVRNKDIGNAIEIFASLYALAEPGTIISGHLAHNLAVCLLMRKNNELAGKNEKFFCAHQAIRWLNMALSEYPEVPEAKAHRTAVHNKIKNTQKEIENNFE